MVKKEPAVRVTITLSKPVAAMLRHRAESVRQSIEDVAARAVELELKRETRRAIGAAFLKRLDRRKSPVAPDALDALTEIRRDGEHRF